MMTWSKPSVHFASCSSAMRFASGVLATLTLIIVVEATCAPKSCKLGLEAHKPACGSDGLSYPNRCQLELARCHNANITFVNRGLCKHPKRCGDYEYNNPKYKFKPLCKPNGSFAQFQCSVEVGFCWCTTPQGTPIPGSLKRYKTGVKPRCGRGPIGVGKKSTRSTAKCSMEDKAQFNRNLIQIFSSDWARDHPRSRTTNDSLVLDWKFQAMDLDHNDKLDRHEYKDLRRLVKQVVKPKRCAKSFAKTCDMNRDQVIERLEWAQCLTRDGMDDVGAERSEGYSGVEDSPDSGGDEEEDDDNAYHDMGDLLRPSLSPSQSMKPNILVDADPAYQTPPDLDQGAPEHNKDDDVTDCKSDRKAALDERSQYVPDCTSDGRYAKVQCYKSAGYCWCVNEDTGKNIPGTALKDKIPTCELASASRPMKGCPDENKIKFLNDLMEYLHLAMVRETNGTIISGTTREDRIITWSFIFYDKNKNQFLDKNEWKTFKEAVSLVKHLRRCGKKLPRYCDINKDRHISLTEWTNCLNTNKLQDSSSSDRNNPLSMLKDD